MKKVISLTISMLLVLGLVTGCGCNKKDSKKEKKEEVKVNTNKDVIKDQEVDGNKMTNTSLVTTNGITKLTTNVTNESETDYPLEEYIIIIKDKDGKSKKKLEKMKMTINKKSNPKIHSLATSFEVLIGYLYLTEQDERLEEIFSYDEEKFKNELKFLEKKKESKKQ